MLPPQSWHPVIKFCLFSILNIFWILNPPFLHLYFHHLIQATIVFIWTIWIISSQVASLLRFLIHSPDGHHTDWHKMLAQSHFLMKGSNRLVHCNCPVLSSFISQPLSPCTLYFNCTSGVSNTPIPFSLCQCICESLVRFSFFLETCSKTTLAAFHVLPSPFLCLQLSVL